MLDSLQLNLRNEYILDGGPFYHEFDALAVVKEPWNTYTSLLFFIPVIFWLIKLKGRYAHHKVILLILPLLFLNGLGSTLYHASRSVPFFLYLDFLPASAMSFILSAFFWQFIIKNSLKAIGIVLLFYTIGAVSWYFAIKLDNLKELGPNIGYAFIGLSFVVPVVIILIKTSAFKWGYVISGLMCLGIALVFRILDHPSELLSHSLSQGTHFLWHIFTVIAAFLLGYYVFYLNRYPENVRN